MGVSVEVRGWTGRELSGPMTAACHAATAMWRRGWHDDTTRRHDARRGTRQRRQTHRMVDAIRFAPRCSSAVAATESKSDRSRSAMDCCAIDGAIASSGLAFREVIYERAFCLELEARGRQLRVRES